MSVKSDMMEIINKATTKKTSAYDSTAEVTRVEGDTIWVHLAGGVNETPVRKTISAKPGDTVQVRVSGGRAWIQGNESAPPTDDRTANLAKGIATKAQTTAQEAEKTAESAENAAKGASATASQAKQIADNTEQHFWFNETGEDTGAHITEVTQDEWNDEEGPNYHEGGNFLARSNGLAVRDGLSELASFSADRARVGSIGSERLELTAGAMSAYNADGVPFFELDFDNAAGSIQYDKTYKLQSTGQKIGGLKDIMPSGDGAFNFYLYTEAYFELSGGISSVLSATNITAVRRSSYRVALSALSLQDFTIGTASRQTASVILNTSRGEESLTLTFDYDGVRTLEMRYEFVTTSRSITFESQIEARGVYLTNQPTFVFGTTPLPARGGFTSTLGEGLKAVASHQTAIGKFNDNKSTNLFEVGNGTADNARSNAFEVSTSGNLKASGSITDGTGNVLANKMDKTVIKQTITSYSSGWSYYNNLTANRPTLRVQGNVVNLMGIMTNTASKTLNATAQTIFTIPEEYAPSDHAVVQAMAGSSYYKYAVAVTVEGNVQFSRWEAGTTYPSISSGSWFPFNLTWIID